MITLRKRKPIVPTIESVSPRYGRAALVIVLDLVAVGLAVAIAAFANGWVP